MNPALSLCAHLGGDDLAQLPIESRDVFDWDDGPIVAVARCSRCPGLGLLELLDWSASRRIRIYALAAIEPDAVAIFQRDQARGSCDLGRLQREYEALLFAAGPVQRLVALDVGTHAVVASAPRPGDFSFPPGAWSERVPPAGDDTWFARLGLAKADRR